MGQDSPFRRIYKKRRHITVKGSSIMPTFSIFFDLNVKKTWQWIHIPKPKRKTAGVKESNMVYLSV